MEMVLMGLALFTAMIGSWLLLPTGDVAQVREVEAEAPGYATN